MRAAGGPAPRTRGCAWTRRFGSRRSGARSSPCRRRPRGKAGFARGWAGSSVKERLLEQIGVARELGHHRNLLVSATGTGKTVRSAADYASLRRALPRDRLLFVAHREEILAQSMATFRHALRDHAFGELWVGGRRPARFEHVFASIQSIHAAGMASLARDHFDVVIIDEFHHAAAPTYPGLLEHVAPRELLGRTATPERSDCLPLLGWFDDRIAAELRLWDAIDQHRLCTFAYFGVHDCLDLRGVPWRRGTGYDVEGLERLFTSNDAWARLMLAALARQVDDPRAIRPRLLRQRQPRPLHGPRLFRGRHPATAVWADSSADEVRRHQGSAAHGSPAGEEDQLAHSQATEIRTKRSCRPW